MNEKKKLGEMGSGETYETRESQETYALGRRLGLEACAGSVIALRGDLGAGKTVLAKGIADGLGITEVISSPTFPILQVYDSGRLPLYHLDVYRIEDPEEMVEVGFDDCIGGDGVCLIEWPERVEELLPAQRLEVAIARDEAGGEDARRITVHRLG